MKKVFCSEFKDIKCCPTCHSDDQFYVSNYKNIRISHCCTSRFDIQLDIDKHSEEPPKDKK